MNKVQQVIDSLTDDDLKAAIRELQVLEETGTLPDGVVREVGRRLQSEAGVPSHDARSLAFTTLFKLAAFRWAGL